MDQCHLMLKSSTYFEQDTLDFASQRSFLEKTNECADMGLSNGPVSSYVKSFTEELHMRPYMVTKTRCFKNKTFLLGLILWNNVILGFLSPFFITFLCVHHIPTTPRKASNVKSYICYRGVMSWRHTTHYVICIKNS